MDDDLVIPRPKLKHKRPGRPKRRLDDGPPRVGPPRKLERAEPLEPRPRLRAPKTVLVPPPTDRVTRSGNGKVTRPNYAQRRSYTTRGPQQPLIQANEDEVEVEVEEDEEEEEEDEDEAAFVRWRSIKRRQRVDVDFEEDDGEDDGALPREAGGQPTEDDDSPFGSGYESPTRSRLGEPSRKKRGIDPAAEDAEAPDEDQEMSGYINGDVGGYIDDSMVDDAVDDPAAGLPKTRWNHCSGSTSCPSCATPRSAALSGRPVYRTNSCSTDPILVSALTLCRDIL
ncbi:hypothetical protein F4818DRAFT_427375 [Hypoxylon cercidicola]|nr:hypothetical protein F4818DRAFT_427375 [Hypoxylon cercidicola]